METFDQKCAWLALEGWEPRWFNQSGGPTITNGTHWVGHMYYKVRPIEEHPNGDQSTRPADWSEVNPDYFKQVWLTLGEQP